MPILDALGRDLKYSVRVLFKSPAFLIAAVLILGLGIGANAVMFTVVNAVVVRPLSFPSSDRLVRLWHVPPPAQFPGARIFSVSPANYLDWRAQSTVFERMAIFGGAPATLTGGGQEPAAFRMGVVSVDFFDVLGMKAIRGRLFQTGEDEQGRDAVVVLGESLWQTRFGGDPGVVGRSILINARPFTVVGVVANSATFPAAMHLWAPLALTPEQKATRGIHDFSVIARLKSNVAVRSAQAELDAISWRLEQQYPVDNTGWGALVVPLQDDIVGDTKTALFVLLGAVAFVMLIASANLANLLLARTLGRSKEIAIRTALGAGRRQVVQQILCETTLLGLAGGALGLVLASSSLTAIVAFVGQSLPRASEITIDGRVLAFTLGVSIAAGIIAGLAPAWRLTGANVHNALKQGLGRTATGSSERRVRNSLVVVEVALALVLLAGAGLLIRTIAMLRAVDPGFDARNVLTAVLVVPQARYQGPPAWTRFYNQIQERIQALPGVEAVSAIDSLPMTGGSTQPIAIEGDTRPMSHQPEVAVRRIMPGYLGATRIRLVAGRDFTKTDAADRSPVVMVSESMARQFWPNQNPIGKRLTLTFIPGIVREVVGVVGDVKMRGLDVKEPVSALYLPYLQRPSPALTLVVRTAVPPTSVGPSIAAAIHQIDAELPVLNVRTLDEVVGASIAQQRFAMQLLGAFAALALLLAAIGIYSVLSYTVRQRVQEIGVRMALGAARSDIVRMVVTDGIRPTLAGVLLGLASALALGRLMTTLVFGVTPYDAATLSAVATILTLVGAVASLVPAYRATKIDPLMALRDDR
jgi:putative ABC transport system permease protein